MVERSRLSRFGLVLLTLITLGWGFNWSVVKLVLVVLMLAAAVSWALGTVLLKRFELPIPTLSLTGWMMITGSVPIAAAAAAVEHDRWRPITTVPALGLVYCVFISFMFCYWAWNRLVLMLPVAVSSISALATPVVGILSGMWVFHEPLTWQEIAATAFILGAIALVLRPGRPDAVREQPVSVRSIQRG